MNEKGLSKLTAMLLTFSMVATLVLSAGMPDRAYAAEDTINFSGGDGTAENPFKVSNAIELSHVTLPGPGAYFLQTAPIDLSGGYWNPLGLFLGHYDGNGFTISNMMVSSSDQSIGLFSELYIGASLHNVTLNNFSIQASGSNSYVGGLVGRTRAGTVITDSGGSGSISFTGGNSIGGLIGLSESTVSDSSGSIAITTTGGAVYAVGGLVGTNYGEIEGSSTNGTVDLNNTGVYAGGLTGANEGIVRESSSSVAVTSEASASAGGLVGSNRPGRAITDSYATGDVSGSNNVLAGGLVGRNSGNISRSYSTGNAHTGQQGMAGGLVGYKSDGTIENSYSTGNASGSAAVFVGGLIGMNNGGDVNYSYSTGSASGGTDANGGLIGFKQGSGAVGNSYYLQGSGASFYGGTPKTAEELKQKSTFASWDFDNTWRIADGYAYPSLNWQPYSALEATTFDYMNLTWDAIKGANDTESNVTEDLTLPETGDAGSTIVWSASPAGLVDTATGSVTRATDDDHEMTLTATITIDGGPTREKDFVLTVIEAPNNKPQRKASVDGTAEAKVTLNTPYTLDLSTIFEDADNDPLSYTVSVGGAAAAPAPANYSYTPSTAGAVTFVFGASDEEDASDDTYAVELTVNRKPARQEDAGATAQATVTVHTPYTIDLATIFEDEDHDVLTYKVSVNGAAAATADSLYSYTPAAAGVTTLVFAAHDDIADSTDTYTVELKANAAPVRRAGVNQSAEETVTVNTPYALDLATIFEDANGDALTYNVSIDGGMAIAAAASYSYVPAASGTKTLVFKANDGLIDSADTYTVELTGNYKPVRKDGVNATATAIVGENEPYTLDLDTIFEDADGDGLTYKVSIAGGTAITAASIYSYTPTVTGPMTLVFTASDGNVDSADTYTVALSVDTIPVRKAGVGATAAASVRVNKPYTLNLATIFEDADGDALSYKVSVDGAAAIAAVSPYTYTPSATGTVTLAFTASDGNHDSTDTYAVTLTVTASSSGGSGSIPPEATDYEATISGISGGQNLPVKVDLEAGRATLAIAGSLAEPIFTGGKQTFVTMPAIPGVDSFTIEVPADALSEAQGAGELVFATQTGSIAVPADMLKGTAGTKGKTAAITIGAGDKSGLSTETVNAIGDRPLIELTLELNGVRTPWNNPSAPVTITIPYKPTAAELEYPEHIVIWYIDGSGNVISIPSGRYDAASGTVTFVTTHFSKYAVAYVQRTFNDLKQAEWARQAIEVMASKGIINGVTTNAFAPKAQITRADYVVLLVKTLGLHAEFDGSFADDARGAYYYEALGVAKQLGIVTGSGGNEFRPKELVTRQDMMVMTARALEKVKGLQASDDLSVLDSFSDSGDIAEYAQASMAVLVKEGLISGAGGKLNPEAPTTRAEAAMFLYLIYNRYL